MTATTAVASTEDARAKSRCSAVSVHVGDKHCKRDPQEPPSPAVNRREVVALGAVPVPVQQPMNRTGLIVISLSKREQWAIGGQPAKSWTKLRKIRLRALPLSMRRNALSGARRYQSCSECVAVPSPHSKPTRDGFSCTTTAKQYPAGQVEKHLGVRGLLACALIPPSR